MSDLSRSSDDTLRAAARIAHAAAADLHVVHAMGLVGLAIGEALVMLHESNIRRTRGALEKELERALPKSRRPTTYGLDYQSAQLAIQTSPPRPARISSW